MSYWSELLREEAERENRFEEEQDRFRRALAGQRCPAREQIIEKMRKDYAKYGKQAGDL